MRANRGRILATLRIGMAVVVVVFVVVAVGRNWGEVSGHLARIGPGAIALSALIGAVAPILTGLGWRALLQDLGSPIHVAPASGIFLVGQLGKYLPGSVWSVLAQAEMGAKLGVPRRRSAVAGLITVGLAVLVALLLGLPSVPLLLRRGGGSTIGWTMLVSVPLLVVVFSPQVLNWGIRRGLRLLHREPLEHELSARAVLVCGLLFIGAWISSGLMVLVLVQAVGGTSASGLHLAQIVVSGFALASAVAMFSVIVPAGVGIREGVLVLLLAPIMPTAAATAVVVLSRFLTIALDVVFALLGWLYARSHHLISSRDERSAEAGQPPPAA